MAIDARGFVNSQVVTDVCIVGTGPAGIAIARELIGADIKVTVLESGTTDFDPQTQQLAAGTTFGDPLIAPYEVVNRQFGGLSNSWVLKIEKHHIGVRYAMFDEIDFEQRQSVAFSGWPVKRQTLMPFFARAQKICKIGPLDYHPSAWLHDQQSELPFDVDGLETSMFQFGRRKTFFGDYRQELENADNITIYHYANAVEVRTKEGSQSMGRVRVACLNGNQFWVTAKVVVLACGAFENARILLMSNKQQPQGLGNQHDVVGRYYHDHPTAVSGYFTPRDRMVFERAGVYDLRQVKGVPVQGYLHFSKPVLQREGLININSMLFPCPSVRQTRALESFKSVGENGWSLLKNLNANAAGLRKRTIPAGFFKSLPKLTINMLLGTDAIVKAIYASLFQQQPLFPQFGRGGGWSALSGNHKRFERFQVRHCIEQTPHPDNRVRLSAELDSLGCPKLEVHWHWHKHDADNLTRTVKLMAETLSHAGLGSFDYELNNEGTVEIVKPSGSHHLMGTTRMHEDPKFGVVDANCQVHGVDNLYIAGSSTFPTGGYANPTLTVVAMALRIADHIKLTLRPPN
ncbi:GMC oxidoreductase [Ferrimonas lipolytica]|uniref:GMC family oxidoreductase n=1 Tax=Ferrimonas lipolytica TaxID=2724191 RepID=A0A6H1UC78_9GAMM|nr:GMC family oxidoreductase [Ferrimonas lipolytica]QIZ76448.1 GMC family oxidoreductase [Ferrimonas lipolytica]